MIYHICYILMRTPEVSMTAIFLKRDPINLFPLMKMVFLRYGIYLTTNQSFLDTAEDKLEDLAAVLLLMMTLLSQAGEMDS